MATKTNTVDNTVEVMDHKCLLYWHSRSLHSLPVSDDERLTIFPGFNAFNYSQLDRIRKECDDLISNKIITFWGIDFKADGTAVETRVLSKIDMKELTVILNSTYNDGTISVLSNPDIVPAAYARYAVERGVKLKDSVGTEADNIEVHEYHKGL